MICECDEYKNMTQRHAV